MLASAGFVLVILAAVLLSGDSRFIAEPLTLDVCPECRQIIQLSANMIFSSDAKVTVFKTLHALCQRLPKEQASECESQVKTYLPKFLRQSPDQQKPDEICEIFTLCASHKMSELQKLHHVTNVDVPGAAFSSASKNKESLNPICPLCLMVIKKLESLLPKNMTEEALMKLMGEVCDLIPKSYKEECDDFVDKYGTEIVEFLLSSAAPHTICTLLHLCLFETRPVPDVRPPSDCESCQTLAALSRLYLGLNTTEPQTSAFLRSVCLNHPKAVPKCEAFTRIYGLQLQRVLGNQMDVPHVCERADLCVSSKQLEPLGKNPCTWGPSYWCKDLETAQKCGNQVFCEKHIWKK
ncbi:surfactant protein Bb [Austrofundulus limnaeus]|uniref:Surfactant protein Bb n=1 Tax=Austrofundulus limnaeus TaxID=52670 RepID=A0A2I4BYJ5_AUSLI|nr:PREDICTED: pulmonary surfactant-associated protein B [Austrofundulus limnaeus]